MRAVKVLLSLPFVKPMFPLSVFLLVVASEVSANSVFSYPVAEQEARQNQLRDLASEFQAQPSVHGEFTQTKHLSVLTQPIESAGTFALTEKGRFHWDIQTPFTLSYTYANDTLTRTENDQTETIRAADEPTLFGFFAFISSIFQLTEKELSEHFTQFFKQEPGEESWVLGLRPKDSRLSQSLRELRVRGNGVRIERAILVEPNGDRTELTFRYPGTHAPNGG